MSLSMLVSYQVKAVQSIFTAHLSSSDSWYLDQRSRGKLSNLDLTVLRNPTLPMSFHRRLSLTERSGEETDMDDKPSQQSLLSESSGIATGAGLGAQGVGSTRPRTTLYLVICESHQDGSIREHSADSRSVTWVCSVRMAGGCSEPTPCSWRSTRSSSSSTDI
jgi:hypothetical protein